MRQRISIAVVVACVTSFVCFFSALLSTDVAAQRIQVGAGSQSCGQWVEARRGDSTGDSLRSAMMTSWVQGYLIGYAIAVRNEFAISEISERIEQGELSADLDRVFADPHGRLLAILQAKFGTRSGWPYDPPDADAIQVWLDAYCREHPLEDVFQASVTLLDEIDKPTQ